MRSRLSRLTNEWPVCAHHEPNKQTNEILVCYLGSLFADQAAANIFPPAAAYSLPTLYVYFVDSSRPKQNPTIPRRWRTAQKCNLMNILVILVMSHSSSCCCSQDASRKLQETCGHESGEAVRVSRRQFRGHWGM